MCCDVCCKEFKGWCQSFTKTERALTILEAVLLALLLVFLLFLILHFLACSSSGKDYKQPSEGPGTEELEYETDNIKTTTKRTKQPTTIIVTQTTTKFIKLSTPKTKTTTGRTIDPEMECSWTPSAKTTAMVHYFKGGATETNKPKVHLYYDANAIVGTLTTNAPKLTTNAVYYINEEHDVDFIEADQSDGENAETVQKKYVLALVKLRPPQDVVLGCILTIISHYWVLTSASCIESIEEVDSLDSFVIMEEYGSLANGKIHSIFDLQIHPFYQGVNKSYDVAALKSESSLVHGKAVVLPIALDYSMITIGERFQVLGFGAYRSIDKSASGRSLRRVFVYRLPALQCPGFEMWSTRHLEVGRAVPPTPCGVSSICGGVLFARGLPCNYCSGTPLLQGNLLLGLMSDNQQCGVACEPQLYVNIAAVRDWIDSVLNK